MSVSTPSQGTHFSDGVRTGPIIGSTFIPGANVLTPSVMVSSPTDQLPPGVFNTPLSLLDVIPAPVSATNIAHLQVPAAAGYLNLVTLSGIGINVITYNSIPNVLQLDCARNVTITGTAGTTAATFTVFGWDQYGVPVVEQITGPIDNNLARGNKAFLYIQAIYVSIGTTSGISVGVGNTFGLPYLVSSINHGGIVYWNNFSDILDASEDEMRLGNDPITTVNGQSIVTISLTGSSPALSALDFVVGQWIQPINFPTLGGITAAQYNIAAQVISLDVINNTLTYKTNGIATSSVTGGGNTLDMYPFTGLVTGDQKIATATTGDVRGTYTPLPDIFTSFSDANGFNRLTINFYNASGDTRNYNSASNGTINLNLNPLTTVDGSAVVSVFAPNHQFTNGENVTISGAVTTNGITSGQLNITAPVTIFDQNNFTYVSTGIATSSDQGGGSVVNMTPRYGNLYQGATGRFGVSQYSIPLF
jgi:hypothetical protein